MLAQCPLTIYVAVIKHPDQKQHRGGKDSFDLKSKLQSIVTVGTPVACHTTPRQGQRESTSIYTVQGPA